MYAHQKQNLVPYKGVLIALAVGFVGFLIGGILFQKPTGILFALTVLFSAAVGPGRALFTWQPEPTAKRQFGTALVAMIVIGVVGAIAADSLLSAYHRNRGECPAWLHSANLCQSR